MSPRKSSSAVAEATTPKQLRDLLNKKFGAGTIMMGSDPSLEIVRIPTGILSFDMHMHGGLPRNRHVELFGTANVGKTYLTYRLLSKGQELGLRGSFLDVEKTFDPKFATHSGVDIDKLEYVPQNVHGNKLIDIMQTYLMSGMYDILVLDSIAALLPKGEYEKSMEEGSYGTEQAKMMSAALRRLTACNKNTLIVFINQTRDSIGSVFAAATRTSGGRAMGFYAGMRIELIRTENIKAKKTIIKPGTYEEVQSDVVVGHRVVVRVKKNKTGGATPESSTTFVFDYRKKGIDRYEDLFYCGRELGWIAKSGDYFSLDGYEDQKKNGRARFKKWLKDNPEIADQLEEWIVNVDFDSEEEEDDEDE